MFTIKLAASLSVLLMLVRLSQQAEISVNITVSKEPRIVVPFDRLNHDEGTNATFTCSIGSGDLTGLTYEWRRDDVVINSQTNPKKLRFTLHPENFQSLLRVVDLKPSDAGTYTCLARNKFGQDKVSTKLSVKVHLKWLIEPTDLEVGAGQSAQIPCKAEGSPPATIEWSKVGDKVESLGAELSFAAVKQEDAGHYECRARNGHDEDLVSRVRLTVLGK